jgi:hypothetical protein
LTIAAASSCAVCPARGNFWRSTPTGLGWSQRKYNWPRCQPPALGSRCADPMSGRFPMPGQKVDHR